jgi:hypothetical protein
VKKADAVLKPGAGVNPAGRGALPRRARRAVAGRLAVANLKKAWLTVRFTLQ